MYEEKTKEWSPFHGYAYDGIYALAQALDEVDQFTDKSLTEFDYR